MSNNRPETNDQEMPDKLGLMKRLESEGVWDTARKFKEEIRRKLRKDGVGKRDAVAQAWIAVEKEYPPVPQITDLDETDEPLPEHLRESGANPDLIRDIGWTYTALSDPDITAAHAPSAGAWALLKWARKNTGDFFGKLLQKSFLVTAAEAESKDAEIVEDDLTILVETLDAMKEESALELAASLPDWVRERAETIADSLRSYLTGDVRGEVRGRLESQLHHLSKDLIKAVQRKPQLFPVDDA